jgi:hypothetical protein
VVTYQSKLLFDFLKDEQDLTLRPRILPILSKQSANMGNKPSSPINTCLSAAVKDIAWPSQPLFALLDAKPYNLDVSVKPVAITYPSKVEEVAAIIKCAADGDYKVQARSGGHSYANYGML